MSSTTPEYEDRTVEGVTLNGFFGSAAKEPVCWWIDVEGTARHLLRGVATLLPRSEVVLIQVEGKLTWQGQWRSVDVSEFFLGTSFAPLSRNAEYNQQYTIIFVREDV